jgi:hypothetical protein
VASDSVTSRDCLMHPGQRQNRITEDEIPHLAASRPEAFDTVGKPLTTSFLAGLPPHTAQVIAGHRDINVTLGYKAAYHEEVINSHLAFLPAARALRPTEEYRTPHRRRMAAVPRPLRTNRGTQNQSCRRRRQARPDRPPHPSPARQPRHAHLAMNVTASPSPLRMSEFRERSPSAAGGSHPRVPSRAHAPQGTGPDPARDDPAATR